MGLGLSSKQGRRWMALLLIVALLLLIQVAAGASSTCLLPEFSHRTQFASSRWFTSRSKRLHRDVHSVDWGKLQNGAHSGMGNKTESGCISNNDLLHAHVKKEKINLACAPQFSETSETDNNHGFSCFADTDLTVGSTILEFPFEQCITAERDGSSLEAAPWEVQLGAKLLKERAQGTVSEWALYLKALPKYVPLPMFFTEMELQNVEDPYLNEEITEMRRFAMLSFHVLRKTEIANAKFSEYAWALSIVYSLACTLEGNGSQHLLLPFLGTTGQRQNVILTIAGATLNFHAVRNIRKTEAISFYRAGTQPADAFLLQGLVPENVFRDGVKLFSGINDLADWYFSSYGGVNNNRYLTVKVVRDAREVLKGISKGVQSGSFSIGSEGNVDPLLLCSLASLSYATKAIELHNSNEGGEAPLDFDNLDGTPWQRVMSLVARESLLRASNWSKITGAVDGIHLAFSFAMKAIQERVTALLASHTTNLLEDELLLSSASWEGSDAPAEQSCSSCRWQIEKQNRNDVQATRFRVSRKRVLERISAKLKSAVEAVTRRSYPVTSAEKVEKLKRFSTWCEKHDFSISDKLTMTFINDSSSPQNLVRGVIVLRDIEEGETLCTLPLDAGLYDGSASSQDIKDSWDLAAVRLLQETSLGKNSKWADYIEILPRDMASPIYLDPTDLHEVQWWPVLRELIQVRRSIRKSFLLLQSSHYSIGDFYEYEWAVVMVHSRAFTLPVLPNDKYSHYVLMPYMDMINHHYSYQADWMSQPVIDRKLEIFAKRSLKRGDQLFASFGPRSNDNLFLYYGFVLQGNPFDSAEIFGSFKDAFSWFIQTWSAPCSNYSQDAVAAASCKRTFWEKTWPTVQLAIEEFEGGSLGQSKDWWELVSQWADFGYQYLPYQPGPTIYTSGISDPSLLAAFTAAAASTVQLPASKSQLTNRNRTALLRQYFDCMKKLKTPVYRPLLQNHSCQEDLISALLLTEETDAGNQLLAKVSIAVRCLEILAALPTSIQDDAQLLKQPSSNIHIQLAREFRYGKKLHLQAVVNRLLERL